MENAISKKFLLYKIALILAFYYMQISAGMANAKEIQRSKCNNILEYISCLDAGSFDAEYLSGVVVDNIKKDHEIAKRGLHLSVKNDAVIRRTNEIYSKVKKTVSDAIVGNDNYVGMFIYNVARHCYSNKHGDKIIEGVSVQKSGGLIFANRSMEGLLYGLMLCYLDSTEAVIYKSGLPNQAKIKSELSDAREKINTLSESRDVEFDYNFLREMINITVMIRHATEYGSCVSAINRYIASIDGRVIVTDKIGINRPSSGYSGMVIIPYSVAKYSSDDDLFLYLMHEEIHAYSTPEAILYCGKRQLASMPGMKLGDLNIDDRMFSAFSAIAQNEESVDRYVAWINRGNTKLVNRYAEIINGEYGGIMHDASNDRVANLINFTSLISDGISIEDLLYVDILFHSSNFISSYKGNNLEIVIGLIPLSMLQSYKDKRVIRAYLKAKSGFLSKCINGTVDDGVYSLVYGFYGVIQRATGSSKSPIEKINEGEPKQRLWCRLIIHMINDGGL